MSFDIDEARSFCQFNRPYTTRAEYFLFFVVLPNVLGQNEHLSSCLQIHFSSFPVSENDKCAVSDTLSGLRSETINILELLRIAGEVHERKKNKQFSLFSAIHACYLRRQISTLNINRFEKPASTPLSSKAIASCS